MKKPFSKIINLTTQHAIFFSFLIAGVATEAAPLSEAHVSQVIQDVRLLATNAQPRPAAINDKVSQGTAVRTGTQSRAELTFTDLTITRLGENTIFSLNAAAREIDVTHGSVLLQVPANSAPAKISTAAVTAAITGGTALFGTGPPVKFMVLEGVGTFYPAGHPELAVTIHGGEMVTLTADGHITAPQTFDVKTVVETSALIVGFPDLANLPLILQVMDQQQVDQSTASSSPPPSKDIIDTTSQNTVANPALSPPPPPSSSPPSEFGPPPTISSPDPYVITSGTTITTDPTITTGGVTNFGTLYRGTALDGSPTEFLFGEAPTVFDQLVFNGSQNNLPIAVFKFADLELTGDPTITIPSGATTNLALVSVGNITSGSPGGTLTFAGITRLDFITQNGSINLGSDISFSGIDHLMFYARGASSNLTLASPISGGSVVHLFSEGTVQVNGNITVTDEFQSISGGDFLAGTGVVTATNIDIASINGNLNIDGSQFPNPPDNTGSVVLNAANTLNLVLDNRPAGFGWASFDAQATTINITGNNTFDFNSADVSIVAGSGGIQASTINFVNGVSLLMQTTDGGDINIHGLNTSETVTEPAGGNVDLTSANDIVSSGGLFVARYNGGITDGLNITIAAGHDLTSDGLDLEVDSSGLSNGGNISVTAGNNITTTGGIFLVTGGSGTGTSAGSDITLQAGAGISASEIEASTGATNGFSLTGSANIDITAGGDIQVLGQATEFGTTGGNVSLELMFFSGGSILSGGNVTLSAGGNLNILNDLTGDVDGSSGGSIGTGGNFSVTTGGALTAGGTISPVIDVSSGGSIGTGGNITFQTGGDFTASAFKPVIDTDSGGNIGIGGNILVNVTGNLAISEIDPVVDNDTNGNIGTGGNISFTVNGNMSNDDFSAVVDNDTNGIIGTGGNITLHVDQNLNAPGGAGNINATVNNSGGGTITSGGNIDIFAGVDLNLGSGGNLALSINNSNGGIITTGGDITASIGGNLTCSTVNLSIDNSAGGQIGTGGNIFLNVGGAINVGGNLSLTADASDIQTGGNIVVTSGGDMTIGGDFTLNIAVASGTTTGVGGDINVTSGGSLTAGSLNFDLFFDPSAQVTNGENLTLTVTKDLITTSGGVTLVLSTPVGDNRPPLLNGGNVSMTIGGNLVLASGGDLDLEMINSGITNVPIGGNIFASVGGNLNANQITADVTNDGDSIIGTGGNLTFSVGGNMTASSVTLDIDNSSNGAITTGGNLDFHVGGDANLGNFALSIDNSNGGVISSGGDITASIGGNLTASTASFNILNGGGTIGSDASTSLIANNISTSGFLQMFTDNTNGSIGNTNLSLTAGGTVLTGGFLEAFIFNDGGHMTNGNVTVDITGNMNVGTSAFFGISNVGGTIDSNPVVDVHANNITTGGFFEAYIDNTNGSMGGAGSVTVLADGTITVGAALDVFGTVTAGGDINAQTLSSTNVTSATSINAGSGGIREFQFPSGIFAGDVLHTLTAPVVTSTGGINFNGVDGTASSAPTNGGQLTINVNSLNIGSDIVGSVTFDGGSGVNSNSTGANGGTFTVNASGDIVVGTSVSAATGENAPGTGFGGAGGTVNLNSSAGSVTVDSAIQVSYGEPITSSSAYRSSASGGTIDFQSNLTTGTGITIGANGQLLSLLNASAPGPGGSITLSTMGADIVVNGTIEADRGTITIDQNDPAGPSVPTITIDGATLTSDTININGAGAINIGLNNPVTINTNELNLQILNGGTIAGDSTINLSTPTLSVGGLSVSINNTTGSISGSASTNLNVAGNATVSGVLQMLLENYDFSGNTPGQIGGAAGISITTGGDLTAGSLIGLINNRSGGSIGSAANLIINVGGALTTSADITDPFGFTDSVFLVISNRFDNTQGNPAGASTINGDATLSVSADSVSIGGRLLANISNSGSTLNGNALLEFGITNNMTVQGEADLEILNDADSGSPSGGTIHGSETLQVSANDFTANALFAFIDNRRGGVIDSDATIAFNLTGNFSIPGTNPGNSDSDSTVPGEADLYIFNQKGTGTAGGTIGGNASITLSAANISTAGLLDPRIINNFGTITGDATINVATRRDNFNGGSPGNLTADSLDVEINNVGGSVGGNETINMNVGGTATITNDATFAITGNDPTGAAAINFNGGDYEEVGGNFRSTIDGNGRIAFNSTTVNANTLKVGVFGPNGTIMIGSGPLSANTLMRLYATGSSGTIDFTKNVTLTLTSQTAAIILAANTITIDQNVVVTIVGSFPASVYANIANYVGGTCGNNCGSFGSFAGKGATTSALGGQPGFDDPPSSATSATKSSASGSTTVASSTASSSTKSQSSSSTTVASSTASSSTKSQSSSSTSTNVASSSSLGGGSRRGHRSLLGDGLKQPTSRSVTSANTTTTTSSTIKVADSGQLLSMLDSATPSSNGKIMITSSKGDGVSNNPSRNNPSRPNAASGLSHDRSAAENPSNSKTSVALLDHAPPSVR